MKKYFLLIICSFFLLTQVKAGGPWPQKKGKGYIKISEWWLIYKQHYTSSGKIDPNISSGIFNTAIYAEYGFTDRLTGVIYAPLLSRNYINNQRSSTTNEIINKGDAVNAFGDIDLSIKYGLTKPGSKIPISATLTFGIPSGKKSAGEQGRLQTGDGEFNQMLQIDAGSGFKLGKKINSYVSGYIGFNHRTQEFSEEFRFGLEYGLGFLDNKLWLAAKLNGIESFKNGATAADNNSTSIFANNSEFISYTLETSYYITKKWGISASYASAFRGEIIAAAPSYSVGVFFDFSK